MRQKPVRVSGTQEDIVRYEVDLLNNVVRVFLAHGDPDKNDPDKFVVTPSQTWEVIEISTQDYEDLLKEKPEINKPAGNFRKNDLWEFIDKIRP